jgi:hypothetical protein
MKKDKNTLTDLTGKSNHTDNTNHTSSTEIEKSKAAYNR